MRSGEPVQADPAPRLSGIDTDLGFGSVVAREARKRLLNRDGTFNVRREGLPLSHALSAYHYLLNISWPRFLGYVIAAYVAANTIFAFIYVACGNDALTAFVGTASSTERFLAAFFFSVQTLATIGYGTDSPANLAANVVVTFESLAGLLGFGVGAGVIFARFSRPVAQIVFSHNAIIAPYRGITALMFRIVNQRANELVNLNATVLLARKKSSNVGRSFTTLKLEREHVVFFPLTWTVVHPIDEESPLFGVTEAELLASDSELLVLLDGFDETFSQTVHTRSSYLAQEVVWGATFRSVFNLPRTDGTISVDIRKIHDFDRVPL